jgi:hypothetical protein
MASTIVLYLSVLELDRYYPPDTPGCRPNEFDTALKMFQIMLGSHGTFFFDRLAGIQLEASIGFKQFRIAPALTTQLQGFRASMETVRGTVVVSWAWVGSDRGKLVQLNVTVPITVSNTTVQCDHCVSVTEGGRPVFVHGTFTAVPGVLAGHHTGDVGVELIVASGVYAFEAVRSRKR